MQNKIPVNPKMYLAIEKASEYYAMPVEWIQYKLNEGKNDDLIEYVIAELKKQNSVENVDKK